MANSLPTVRFVTGTEIISGAERSLLLLAGEMEKSRLALPELVTRSTALAKCWREAVNDDVILVAAKSGRISRVPGFLSVARSTLRGRGSIVLFDHYLLPAFAVAGVGLSTQRRAPLIVDVHDSLVGSPRRQPYFWLMGHIADRAICISRFIAEQVAPRLHPTIVYRPVQCGRTLARRRNSIFTIGVVAQVSGHKRQLEAVDLVANAGEGFMLVIRGAPAPGQEAYLKRVIARGAEKLGDRFRYDGLVPMAQAMDGIDVLLALNDLEPFGRVVAEAQAAGVVPIVLNRGGSVELVSDRKTGLVVDDLGEVSAAIAELHASAALWQQCSDMARTHAARTYSLPDLAQRYVEAVSGNPSAS